MKIPVRGLVVLAFVTLGGGAVILLHQGPSQDFPSVCDAEQTSEHYDLERYSDAGNPPPGRWTIDDRHAPHGDFVDLAGEDLADGSAIDVTSSDEDVIVDATAEPREIICRVNIPTPDPLREPVYDRKSETDDLFGSHRHIGL